MEGASLNEYQFKSKYYLLSGYSNCVFFKRFVCGQGLQDSRDFMLSHFIPSLGIHLSSPGWHRFSVVSHIYPMNQTTHSVLAGMEQNGMHMIGMIHLVPSMNTNAFYYVSSQSVVYPPLAKLFVGQIPKTMQTEDVSRIFQQSYPVQRVHIIRDRITGEHKGWCFSVHSWTGCAFIYVEASIADQLIAAFHNKITCEGVSVDTRIQDRCRIPFR